MGESANGRRVPASRYELIVYWSEPDAAFVVEVPDLPGCMADGPTYAEAVTAAELVIREGIDTARALDRPIPEPRAHVLHG
jgi:predicted RNase H-like HicB family nuclease